MKDYKAVTFKSPEPGRYRDDPLACATEEDSLLYSPIVGEGSISESGHLLRCYRKNRALCVVVVLAVAIGIVFVKRSVLCEEFSSPSLVTMDLTDLPLLGAPRHDHRAHEKRGRDAHHKHHSLGRHHERIEGRGRHHDRRESRRERNGGHHRHRDASEERSPGRHHHHKASDREERASDSVDDERSEGRDHGHEEASEEEDLVSGSVDQEELPSDSVDPELEDGSVDPEDGSVDPEEDSADPDERSGRRHHRHHKRGRRKRRKSVRGKSEEEEDELLSCEELMIGVFEQECIAAVGTSQGTFASAPTGDGGLVGIGLGGRRMSKFSIGNVDLELQSVSLEGVNNSEDGLPVFHTPQAPAAPEAPAAPADGTAIAVDDGPADNQGEEDPEADQGEQGDSEEDSEEEEDDGPEYCMRTVTTSSEPGWISETSIAKYNEMGHDNSKIFWTWGGNTAVCSFKKLEGRDCRRALDKITRSFKRDETVDLGAFSHRDLC